MLKVLYAMSPLIFALIGYAIGHQVGFEHGLTAAMVTP